MFSYRTANMHSHRPSYQNEFLFKILLNEKNKLFNYNHESKTLIIKLNNRRETTLTWNL